MVPFLFLLALQAAEPDTALAEMKRAFDQSCAQRAYGSFDDVCTQMADQIAARERDDARAVRRRPRTPPPAAPPAAAAPPLAPVPAPAPTPAAASSGTPSPPAR